jgi:hypothetical protein
MHQLVGIKTSGENMTMKEADMFRNMPDDYTWFREVTDASKVCERAYRI